MLDSDREFIVGNTFTAADVAIGSSLYWGFNLIPILPKHEALVDYWDRLAQRPAWKAANEAADA